MPLASQKTCCLQAGRRAACTPQDAQGARRSKRASEAGHPVRPFSSPTRTWILYGNVREFGDAEGSLGKRCLFTFILTACYPEIRLPGDRVYRRVKHLVFRVLAQVSESSAVEPRGGRRDARRSPLEHRASSTLSRALAKRLSRSRCRGKLKFRRVLKFSFFSIFLLKKRAKNKKKYRFESHTRARVLGGCLLWETFLRIRNTYRQQNQQ